MPDLKKMLIELKNKKLYDRLSQWEKDFVLTVPHESRKMSGRQMTKLFDIYHKVVKV